MAQFKIVAQAMPWLVTTNSRRNIMPSDATAWSAIKVDELKSKVNDDELLSSAGFNITPDELDGQWVVVSMPANWEHEDFWKNQGEIILNNPLAASVHPLNDEGEDNTWKIRNRASGWSKEFDRLSEVLETEDL